MTASATICQINGQLSGQCCGQPADMVYLCEQIAPPGHRCQIGEHTILHDRMGNGYTCAAVEDQLRNRGGLRGWYQVMRYDGSPTR